MATSDGTSDGVLDDGAYDAFVVWAEARADGRVTFDLTITSGAHKGETISVIGPPIGPATRDPIDLVGLPCTLVVEHGVPRVEFS
jgi:hypothetical protein